MNIINNDFKTLYKNLIDELIRPNSLSLLCKLIYEGSVFDECINCYIDPITNKSSNNYKTNGPMFFIDGQICPYCRGLGGTYKESYDNVNFMVIFDYKYWEIIQNLPRLVKL
jgi:hypothetical protein